MIVIAMSILAIVLVLYLTIRNNQVHDFLIDLGEQVFDNNVGKCNALHDKALKELQNGIFSEISFESKWSQLKQNNDKAWEVLNSLNYNRMVLTFWKPVPSFITPKLKKDILWEWNDGNE